MTGLELSAAARHVVLTEMSLAASLIRAELTAMKRMVRAPRYSPASAKAYAAICELRPKREAAYLEAFASLAALKGVIGKDLGGEEPVDVEADRCEAWARIEAAGELAARESLTASAR